MFWESGKEKERIASFIRDYCNPEMRLTDVIRLHGMGKNVMAAHRAARRLGLPPRRAIPQGGNGTTRVTAEGLQTRHDQLSAELRELERQIAQRRVDAAISGECVTISGLAEQPFTTDRDQLRAFIRGGGLAKMRRLAPDTAALGGTVCCD